MLLNTQDLLKTAQIGDRFAVDTSSYSIGGNLIRIVFVVVERVTKTQVTFRDERGDSASATRYKVSIATGNFLKVDSDYSNYYFNRMSLLSVEQAQGMIDREKARQEIQQTRRELAEGFKKILEAPFEASSLVAFDALRATLVKLTENN